MSKNKNGNKFNNRAARRFNDLGKVDTMSQEEIYSIFDEDMSTILGQVTAYREHKPNSPYPPYIANAFANLSTPLYFKEYVDEHVKVKKKKRIKTDLSEDDLESLRMIIADAYKKSCTQFYGNQVQEYPDRNNLLSHAFVKIYPDVYHRTKKLDGLSSAQRRDLTIQVYGDPVFNFRFIHRLINESTTPDKKKLKILKKLYGKKRFVRAVGAAMTVESNASDCLAMLFEFVCGLKKRDRAPFLRTYADAYKRNKTRYFRIDSAFIEKNRKIIKELRKIDIGYKKAFRDPSKEKGGKHGSKKQAGKKPGWK